MARRKLTEEQKEARQADRSSRREKAAAKVRELRAWRQDRLAAAKKREAIKVKSRKEKAGSRGVDRVPEFRRGHGGTWDVETPELGSSLVPDGKGGARTIQANYRTRRAHGARGKVRRPRRRDLTRYAVGEMTKGERKLLDQELAAATQAGKPLTDRAIRARAWAIMRDARFPKAPAQ